MGMSVTSACTSMSAAGTPAFLRMCGNQSPTVQPHGEIVNAILCFGRRALTPSRAVIVISRAFGRREGSATCGSGSTKYPVTFFVQTTGPSAGYIAISRLALLLPL